MKSPEKNRSLPSELDPHLKDLADRDVQRLNEIWEASADAGQIQDVDPAALDRVWLNIESELDKPATVHALKPAPARIIPMRWMAIAATILIGAFGFAYFLQPQTVIAPMGETAQVVLHDGSTVELNSGSSLTYGRRFSTERRVRLRGEAFFDIVKDEKPFIVETFNASVTVLGTTFNVRAWENERAANTKVALQSGSVRLAGKDKSAETIQLAPGQTGTVDIGVVLASAVDTVVVSNALAWRQGSFFFSNEWLGAILDDVGRRFDTNIQISPFLLRNERMKYALENPASAEAVVNDLSKSLGLKYRETSTGFEIFDPK